MALKDDLKKMALDNGMDYFGVGPVSRWANAPVGHRPNDLLAEAKTVIVMGMRVPEGCIEANHRAYEGYNLINDQMEDAALKLSTYLEDEIRVKTFLPPASVGRDEYKMMGIISNRHSAVCAGLAEFGWNGLALTPDAGPRVRWVIIVTEADLEPDPLYSGKPLCKNCHTCVAVCPINAISDTESVTVEIEDRTYTYNKLNRPVCRSGVTGLAAGTAGRLQAENVRETVTKVEDWLKLVQSDNKWNRLERTAAMCGRCMILCPVGRE
jgi:epoxyqueuosine reductase